MTYRALLIFWAVAKTTRYLARIVERLSVGVIVYVESFRRESDCDGE